MHDVVAYHAYLVKKLRKLTFVDMQLHLPPGHRILEEPHIFAKCELRDALWPARSCGCFGEDGQIVGINLAADEIPNVEFDLPQA